MARLDDVTGGNSVSGSDSGKARGFLFHPADWTITLRSGLRIYEWSRMPGSAASSSPSIPVSLHPGSERGKECARDLLKLHLRGGGSDLILIRMARAPPDPVFTLRGSAASVNTLHFHCAEPGLPLLYSGSGKGLVHVWNLNTRRAESVLDGHAGASVIWVSTVRSTNTFLSHGRDMKVCVWDLHEGRKTVVQSLYTGSVGFCQCFLLEADGSKTLLALPGENMAEIKVTELANQTLTCSLIPDDNHGMLMCIKMWQSDTGPLLCAGYEDGSLLLWDVSYRRPLSSLKVHPEPVMCLDFDVGKQKGISGSSDKSLCSWTLDGQQNLQIQDSVPLTNPGVSHLSIRGDEPALHSANTLAPEVTQVIPLLSSHFSKSPLAVKDKLRIVSELQSDSPWGCFRVRQVEKMSTLHDPSALSALNLFLHQTRLNRMIMRSSGAVVVLGVFNCVPLDYIRHKVSWRDV
ncbi:guanine nucleotide-binding protein subunit beta-like protein 1 [Silurus asotus]|uniref:Guanine nucleotide-binding protein subunit beta-like protein 1 n=1 Tax=Silurus asotus TaxID=30991 RepID=A0AAD5FF53_SILAS|nr:guanine nucleotide-binding protein subunit beta-like protein 1 [Silurus asotus]